MYNGYLHNAENNGDDTEAEHKQLAADEIPDPRSWSWVVVGSTGYTCQAR